MKEFDIRCPGCGQVFQVAEQVYIDNQDIVCPTCVNCEKVFKPRGNELARESANCHQD